MFAKTIIDSDAFIDMPLSTQALYFHLSMRGDDDGFINNPKKIQRMIGASEDDLKLLVAKKFIIPFDSGIVVIKHWKIHNYIRGDRKKNTVYPEEMALLIEKDNGAYSLRTDLTDICLPIDGQMSAQGRLGQVCSGQGRVVEGSENGDNDTDPEDKIFEFQRGKLGKGVVILTQEQSDALLEKLGIDAYDFYIDKLAKFILEKNATVGNHYKTILKWASEDAEV